LNFFPSLAAVGAILVATTLVGRAAAFALLPRGPAWRAEGWGWSIPLGAAIVAAATGVFLALGAPPMWPCFLAVSALVAIAAWRNRLPEDGGGRVSVARSPKITALLVLLLVSGVALYLLRALTEPMWSNDYLAIWGLKAKTIYFARTLPQRVLPENLYGFSHPEYPLGLPLLLAGISSLLGQWEDHAAALFFPAFQVATLAAVWGWLRRRGVRSTAALAAAALLSQFEPLYSGFLTGLAEVPLSCVSLLFGTAFSDALDAHDAGAPGISALSGARRLAAASLLAGGLKNEGLLLAALGAIGALIARRRGRWRIAACALLPAAAIALLWRTLSRDAPLRDFDFGLLATPAELPGRLLETLRTAAGVALSAWPVLLCLGILFAAGRRTSFADRLLALAAALAAVYCLVPTLAAAGPAWLVSTSLARTSVALAPLLAAGLTGRLPVKTSGESSAASADPREWEARAATPTPSIREN
jgi:hypothetical protein